MWVGRNGGSNARTDRDNPLDGNDAGYLGNTGSDLRSALSRLRAARHHRRHFHWVWLWYFGSVSGVGSRSWGPMLRQPVLRARKQEDVAARQSATAKLELVRHDVCC